MVLAVAVSWSAPGVAAGSSLVRLHGTAEGSPAWSGANVLVLLSVGHGLRVDGVDPTSGAASVVASIPRSLGTAQLAASPALIGVEQADPRCNEALCKYQDWQLTGEELLAAPPGDMPQCLAGFGSASCGGLGRCAGAANALVSSSRIAYRECAGGNTGQTVVVDYSTMPPTRSVVPQVAVPESISGPWLVGLSPGWMESYGPSGKARPGPGPAVVERDLETGAEPLHVELSKTGSENASESSYPALASVQRDGRIVYVVGSGRLEQVFTASPAEPDPRPILSAPVPLGSTEFIPYQRLLLAGDVLALEERLRPSPYARQRLELANLGGERLGGIEIGEIEPFDFNGSELAAVNTPCVESFLTTWSPGQPQPARPPGGVCPTPRLERISVGRQGLTATVACPDSPPLGCLASTIRVEVRLRGRAVSSKGKANRILPGRRAMLTTPLSTPALRWLRRHRNLPAIVRIESELGEPTRITRAHLR